jgi:hypothetical protein
METRSLKPVDPNPVKPFTGILYSNPERLDKALELLSERFGEIDCRSRAFDFAVSDYYHAEMGSPIWRIFVSFKPLVGPDELAKIKIDTNAIEDELAVDGKRLVNIDSGYLDYDKVVLASAKYNWAKIYLKDGIWADLTLHFEKGNYDPLPWSFPDFKSGIYNSVFLEMRRIYKGQRKGLDPTGLPNL